MASLKDQLTKITLRKAKLTTGETVEQMMAHMVQKLYDNIQYYIDKWYNEYHPKIYDRTGNYRDALYAEDIADIRVVGDTLVIGLGFYDNLAWQESLSEFRYTNDRGETYIIHPKNGTHETFVPLIMEIGWHSKKLEGYFHKRLRNFTYFYGFRDGWYNKGIHAVEFGIRDLYKEYPFMRNKVDWSNFYLADLKRY